MTLTDFLLILAGSIFAVWIINLISIVEKYKLRRVYTLEHTVASSVHETIIKIAEDLQKFVLYLGLVVLHTFIGIPPQVCCLGYLCTVYFGPAKIYEYCAQISNAIYEKIDLEPTYKSLIFPFTYKYLDKKNNFSFQRYDDEDIIITHQHPRARVHSQRSIFETSSFDMTSDAIPSSNMPPPPLSSVHHTPLTMSDVVSRVLQSAQNMNIMTKIKSFLPATSLSSLSSSQNTQPPTSLESLPLSDNQQNSQNVKSRYAIVNHHSHAISSTSGDVDVDPDSLKKDE